MFDFKDQGFLSADDLDDILRGMGFRPSKEELKEPDEETMKHELKEAFRVYDKEANGFITTDTLREIISELDQRLTKEDLDGIIEEIDEDGSGTMDFDEFCAMMMS